MAPSAKALVVKEPSQGYSSTLPFRTSPGVAKDWPTHDTDASEFAMQAWR